VVNNVALGEAFLRELRFSPVSVHHCSILFFIYTLLLPKGYMGEAWEPSKKQCSFGSRGSFDREVLSFSGFIQTAKEERR
jgi:hypothetical protein